MTVTVTHATAPGSDFSPTGATAWQEAHTVTGLGAMAEQAASAVAITGGTVDDVTLTRPIIGSTTWAGRPSAASYTGSIVKISDLGPMPSLWISDGTNWNPLTPTVVVSSASLVTGTTSASDQLVLAMQIPLGILIVGRVFAARISYGKSGTTDAMTAATTRMGENGTIADTSVGSMQALTAGQRSSGIEVWKRMASATSVQALGVGNGGLASWANSISGGALLAATTISDVTAAATYFSVTIQMAGTTNSPQTGYCEIVAMPR